MTSDFVDDARDVVLVAVGPVEVTLEAVGVSVCGVVASIEGVVLAVGDVPSAADDNVSRPVELIERILGGCLHNDEDQE